MARKRYQRGTIALRGNSWEFRWREDVIEDGKLRRIDKREVFATKKKYATKKLALRDDFVTKKLTEINSPAYRAMHRSNFREFATRWAKQVLVNLEPSTQSSTRSQLGTEQKDPKRQAKRKFPTLLSVLGDLEVSAINTEILQSMVTFYRKQGASPKTIKNLIATMRMLWSTARDWEYATHDPFKGLKLPDSAPAEVPFYEADQMKAVINGSEEPYRTLWWLTSETGIRRSEVCALRVMDVTFRQDSKEPDQAVVIVRRKVWNGIVGNTKSKRPRVFVLSPVLTEHLQQFLEPIRSEPEHLVFTNRDGGILHPDNLVKRHLKPVLKAVGIARGGMHAFRHGNATIMDQKNVPMKVRQDRLGHVDPNTTMGYTHSIGEDERRTARELGEILRPNAAKEETAEQKDAFAGSEGFAVQ